MQFAFTDEQDQFRDVVSRFLSRRTSTSDVRRLMASDSGYDPDVWQELSQSLGVCGLSVPEQYGGAGFGMVELCIVAEEMGQALYCGPFFGHTVLSTQLLLLVADDSEKQALLPAMSTGERLTALAWAEDDGDWTGHFVQTCANNAGRLDGAKSFVVDGTLASQLLVLARDTDTGSLDWYLIDPGHTGVERRSLQTLDGTRRLAHIRFQNVPAKRLGQRRGGQYSLKPLLDAACIVLANEMVGGAQKMLDSALAYTRIRMQFGRRISSFQAVKHRLADLLLEIELARSAAYYAAAAWDQGDANLSALASMAKSSCAEAFMHAAAECIQLHGGIGFTWDHDTHLWFRRAKSDEVFLGDPAWHRERMLSNWQE